jgi:hypothetical protein
VRSEKAPAEVKVGLRVADLDDVGRLGLAGQRGGQLLHQAVPLLLLDGQRGAGVLVLEGLLEPVAGLLRSVRPVEPDADVRGLRTPAVVRRRTVVLAAARGECRQRERGDRHAAQ